MRFSKGGHQYFEANSKGVGGVKEDCVRGERERLAWFGHRIYRKYFDDQLNHLELILLYLVSRTTKIARNMCPGMLLNAARRIYCQGPRGTHFLYHATIVTKRTSELTFRITRYKKYKYIWQYARFLEQNRPIL